MRVAFDGRSLTGPVLRGWDRYVVGLIAGLQREGVEVALLHRARQELNPAHVTKLGCEVIGLEDRSGVWWEQVALPRAVKEMGFDLYHAPAERGIPLMSSRPSVITLHSATVQSYRDFIQRGLLSGNLEAYLGLNVKPEPWRIANIYWSLQVHRAQHVFTPSEFAKEEIVRLLGVPAGRVTVTPPAVDEQFLRAPDYSKIRATLHRLGVQRPFVLYVGGYEPHKNIGGLLRAFVRAGNERPELSLVLVGSGSVPTWLQATCHAIGVAKRAVCLANITDELPDLYDAAESMVTLSWRESFCLPALEAMTRGVPVISSAWGATSEVVGDGGLFVDPRDEEDAAEAILRLADPAFRSRLARRARRRAEAYSWEATTRQTIAVYERVLSRNKQLFTRRVR